MFINQKYIPCLPCRHKSFCRLGDFEVSGNPNLSIHKNLNKLLCRTFLYTLGKKKMGKNGKRETRKNGNEGTNCCNCLLKLGGINMHFHQKRL